MEHFVSSDRNEDNERAFFQDYLRKRIVERLPPGCQITPELEAVVDAFVPTEYPEERKGFIDATALAADYLLVELWRVAYLDPKRGKAVLKYCLQRAGLRFPETFPVIRSMLINMRPERRWIFLLRAVQGFNVECTSNITGFSRRKVERLHGTVRSMIDSCKETKKGDYR